MDEKVVVLNENCCRLWICLFSPRGGHTTVITYFLSLSTQQAWYSGIKCKSSFVEKLGHSSCITLNLKNQRWKLVSLIKRRWICCLSSIFWHWCRIFGNYNPSNSAMGWTFGRIYISLLAAIRQIRSCFCVLKLSLTRKTYTNKSWVVLQNFNSWPIQPKIQQTKIAVTKI